MAYQIQRLPGGDSPDVAFYDGYQRGHLDTAKMLGRRSMAYMFVGGFFGAAMTFLIFSSGIWAQITTGPKVIEDPLALGVEKPKQYARAIDFAKQYTVGIIAETAGRRSGGIGGYRVPGQQHVGSGIVLDENGYILTNSHVIPDSTSNLEVVLGEKAYPARFVGRRADYDLAVIKINATALKAASLGDSDKVEQGDVVIALGSPYGLMHTATEGIISFVGRDGAIAGTLVPNYLQTSAAINAGNSGGPLIDLTGRVVGINTWKIPGSANEGGADGLGFAIPINVARKVSERILKGDDRSADAKLSSTPRNTRSAFLGIEAEKGLRTDLPEDGVVIKTIIVGGAAEQADLKAGDLILAVADVKVTNYEKLVEVLGKQDPGADVEIRYRRDGEERITKVKLGGRNK
ncbi:MAG: trypsin-like peptidase domain-containing protein [Planctomycetes bacterium]|nr:trypsin-like peptidase domain-containing protein [Planctomycetota bacterium]